MQKRSKTSHKRRHAKIPKKKFSKRLIHFLVLSGIALAAASTYAFLNFSNPGSSSASYDHSTKTYLETFDGNPEKPTPFTNLEQSDWDIAIHSRDSGQREKLNTMEAHHGHDCSAPLDASGNLVTHTTTGEYEGAVFKCKDHIMTSINEGGYGVIYLTPRYTINPNDGTTISFNMSTLVTSQRDWVDIWITPYEDNLQLPLDDWLPDLQGTPKNAIHIKQEQGIFKTFVISNYNKTEVTTNGWTKMDTILTPSPKDRAKFELTLSKNHIKFGIPEQALTENRSLYWVDTDIPELNWANAVVQLGHHSYTPEKDCNDCKANTWHWDNIYISNATPFTMIKSDKRRVSQSSESIIFSQPAPKNSMLRFSGLGTVNVSFDNGTTWEKAVRQEGSSEVSGSHHPEHFSSYWTPIPEGAKTVMFKFTGDGWYNGAWPYEAKDFAIWALEPNVGGPNITDAPSATPSITVDATSTPTPTATTTPTPTPTQAPTLTPKPTTTVTPTPIKLSFTSLTTARPSTMIPGSKTTIKSSIKTNKNVRNVQVMVEVYNSNYKKVFEKYYGGQNFTAGKTKTFTQTWSTPSSLAPGEYRVTVGVFDYSWKALYWNDSAAKITIQK